MVSIFGPRQFRVDLLVKNKKGNLTFFLKLILPIMKQYYNDAISTTEEFKFTLLNTKY